MSKQKETAECVLWTKQSSGGGTPLPRRPLLGLVAKMRVHQGNRALPGVQPVSHSAAVMAIWTVMARESPPSLGFSPVSMRRYTVFLSACAGFPPAVCSLYSTRSGG